MNKISAIIILFLLISTHALPQEESSFYDAPFGGGIGYTPGWIVPHVYGVNNQLKEFGVPDFQKTGFFTSGFSGFIYLGILKNFRIGGMGFGGSFSTTGSTREYVASGIPTSVVKVVQMNTEALYSLSGGGVTIEYTLPYVRNFGISVGALIGRGSLSVELYKNTGGMNWRNYWKNADNYSISNFSGTLKDKYWIFTPMLNVDIPAFHLLCFRIGGGYQITFGDKWTYDNNQDLTGAPSSVNGNSFYMQAGVLIGIFSF